MASKHTHKYHKVTTDAGVIWSCALPNCSHFMPSHYTPLLVGKASICWGCASSMILDDQNMRDNQPQCDECKGMLEVVDAVLSGQHTQQK